MVGPIQPPIKGQPMRASWGAAVSSAVSSLLPMGSDGLLARQGVAGTGFAALPQNKRDRRAASVLPWSFSCTEAEDPENPGETVRTGGWKNCILQLGYKTFFFSPEFQVRLGYNAIEGTDTCDDGEHYVVVDSIARTVRIEVAQSAADAPQDDPANGVVVLRIGTVREAKLTQGLHVNPVIPLYL